MKSFFILFILLSNLLTALPHAPEVVSGEVLISQTDHTMTITPSDRAIINYQEFNVGHAEKLQFIQPNSQSTVLNRVTGRDPSQILGNISSNGKVFLVNPHGVYFGKEANIDTGSLVVSSLDILDQDFLEDRFSFHVKDGMSGFIHNEGTLTASYIGLISPYIKNEGTIRAYANKVVLASGEAVTLTFSGEGLISFEIEEGETEGIIEHLGSIEADEVFINVAAAKQTIQNVINTDGLIEGNTLTERNGKIRIAHQSSIKADNAFIEASKITVEGEIDVSTETIGGTLHVLGDHLELRGARIDASGDLGGGTVLIGGEYKGQGDVRTALTNFMDENSLIKANALTQGDGGRVILWADDTTIFNGTIFAQGGAISGNGGFVETSGKERLGSLTGHVNTLASHGSAGTWLLDPLTITLVAGSGSTLAQAANCADVTTNLTIDPATINAAASNVVLCVSGTAAGSINQNSGVINITTSGVGITFQGSNTTASPTTLNANISTNGGVVSFVNAAVNVTAGFTMDTTGGGATTAGANITFDATSTMQLGGLTFKAGTGGVITFGAALGGITPISVFTFTSSAGIRIGANITFSGASTITFAQPVTLTAATTTISIGSSGQSLVFGSTLNGACALTLTGGANTIQIGGTTGGITPLSSLTISTAAVQQVAPVTTTGNVRYTGTSSILIGNIASGNITTTTSGATITMIGVVNLLSNTNTFTTNNGNISFSSTINGVRALTFVAGTGTVTFSGAVGGTTALTNLVFTSSGGINIGGNISVTGANPLTFGQAVSLTGPSTITSNNANIAFSSTLNGAQALTIAAGTGTVTFTGIVGGTTPPTNITFTSSGGIRITASMTLSGANTLTFAQAVSLLGTSTITSFASPNTGANIAFSSTVNGAQALTLASGTGTVTFSGAVGGVTSLSSLIVSNAQQIRIGANITSSGNATQFILGAPIVVTTTSSINAIGGITLGTTIDGPGGLSITGPGSGSFVLITTVGGTTPLASFSFSDGLDLSITLPITTVGAVSLSGRQLFLLSNITTSGGTVTLTSSVRAITPSNNPVIDTTNGGATPAGGSINVVSSSSTLTATASTSFTLNGGTGGTVTLGPAVSGTFSAFTVTGGTINQNAAASTTGVAGGTISYTAPTAINVKGNITTAGGAVTMTGPVILTNAISIDTTNGGGTTTGANINFSGSTSTINFAAASANTLTLRAGTSGNIIFSGAVGGSTAPTNITFTSSTAIQVGANITVSGANPLTFGQAVQLTGPSTITSNNANVSFSSTINGAQTLTIAAGSGTITFSNTVGSTTALSSLSATSTSAAATAIRIDGGIKTSGAITMTGIVSLTNTATLDSTNSGASAGANISFSSTLNGTTAGTQGLTVTGGTGTLTFTGAVGGITTLASITATSSTINQSSTVQTSGAVSYTGSTAINVVGNITTSGGAITMTGPVTLTNAITFDSTNAGAAATGANINFSGATTTINFSVSKTLTLIAGTSGVISLGGAVGGSVAPTNIIFTSGSAIQVGANITVTGANPLIFPFPVQLTGTSTITSNNANVSFSSTINGAQSLTVAGGNGTVTFTGAVGGTTPLTSLSATSTNIINVLGNITTSGGIITMTGPVNMPVSISVDTTNAGGTPVGANISFSSTLNGGGSLSFIAGTAGTVTFSGIIGGTTPLAGLTVTASTITQSLAANLLGALSYTASTAINVLGSITTSGGAIAMIGPVSLTNALTFDSTNNGGVATGADISFSSTLNWTTGNTLTFKAGTIGIVSFSGIVGGSVPPTNLIFTNANKIQIGGNITVSGANPLNFAQAVSLTGPSTITNSTNNITFSSTLDGGQDLILQGGSGILTFTGAIGSIAPLSSLTVTSSTITQTSTAQTSGALSYTGSVAINVQGNITTSGGAITMIGPVSLANAPTFNSTNGASTGATISFSSTVDGATSLTLQAGTSGNVVFSGNIGTSIPLTNLIFTSAALIQIGANITVTGASTLNFTFPVSLTAPVTITSVASTGNITFSSTLNGANALTLTPGASGTVIFSGVVGGTAPLTNLIFSSASSTQIGANITVSGASTLTFLNPVILIGSSTIASANTTGNIAFSSTINGANSLVVAAGSGTITFSSAVGGGTALTSLIATSSSAINVQGSIKTSGIITMAGPVSLSNNPTFDSTNSGGSSGGNISFTSTVNGSTSLTIQAGTAGTVSFGGAVSLNGLSFISAASIQIGSNITVASALTFPFPVSLTGPSTITSGNTNITFSSTIDGAQVLTLVAGSGIVTFSGIVGGTTPLSNLVFTSASAIQIGANIRVTGGSSLNFSAPVTLTGPSTISSVASSGNITFSSTINGAYALTLAPGASGTVIFSAVIGGTAPPTNLIFSSAASTQIGANITVSGANPLTFTNPVILTGSSTIASANTTGNIAFSSTINGSNALVVAAGSGTITFSSAIGAITPLTSLTATSSSSINVQGNITTSGGIITMTGPVAIANSPTFDTTSSAPAGANISFSSTLNGATALTLLGGTGGAVTFTGIVGGAAALTNLSVTSSIIIQSSALTTTGAVTYTNTGLATIAGAITAGSFTQSGGGSTLLEANITAASTILFTNAVTFNTAIVLTAPSGITLNTMIPTSNGIYNLTLTATAGAITATQLGSPSEYINTLTMTALSLSTPIIYANNIIINGSETISANVIAPGAHLEFTVPVTVSTGTFIIDVTGGASAGSIAFDDTLDGPGGLTFIVGAGDLLFSGAVGSITPFGNATVTSAHNVTVSQNFTGSSFTQTAGTGTTLIAGTMSTSTSTGVSLTGNIFTLTGSIITTGAGPVSFNNSGQLTLSGPISSNGPVSQTGSGAVSLGSTITTTNAIAGSASVSFAGPVSLASSVTINTSTGNGAITFGSSSTINGVQSLTLTAGTGTVTFSAEVGGSIPLTNLAFGSAGLINIGSNITVTVASPLTFTAPVNLTGNSTITSNGANITFSSTINGAHILAIAAGSGTITFSSAIGGITPLAILTAASTSSINVQGNITTSGGAITMTGPVAIANSPTFDTTSSALAGANISFSSTLNGATALTLLGGTGGTVTFTGIVGGAAALTSLSVTSSIITQSSALTTTGAVTYTNAGLATIAGAITAGSFTQNGGGSTLLEANITAASTILFTNAVTFNTAIVLTAPSGITLNTMIPTSNGIYNLTLTAAAGTITATQLGSPSEYIDTLTMTALVLNTPLIYANTVIINGSETISSNIIAPGAQLEFTVPVTVSAGTFIIDVTGGATTGNITFDSTLDGPGGLTFIVGAGDLLFTGAVGSITPFGNATVTSAHNVTVSQNFTGSSFTQTAGTGTTLIAGTMSTSTSTGVSLTGNIFTLTGSIITTGAGPVAFDNAGLLTISGSISSNGAVSQIGGGAVSLGSSITTTNGAAGLASVLFTNPITLTAAVAIDTSIGGGDVTFGSSATINGAQNLSFALGAGTVTFSAAIGGSAPLTDLIFTSGSAIQIGNSITVTGGSPLVFSDPVLLIDVSTITSNSADITFSSTLDGAHSLTLLGGSGTITFTGAVGKNQSIRNLSVTGGIITQSDSLAASGTVTYTNAGLATIGGTVSTGSFIQSGGGTVLLEASMIALNTISFTNDISFNSSIFMVGAGPGGITLNKMIPTLSGVFDLALSAQSGAITATQLGSPLEYINTLTLSAKSLSIGSIYANTIIDNGTETINSNIIAPGAYLLFPRPTTVAAGTFTIDVSGGGHPGVVKFYSTLDGPGGLTFVLGEGSVAFDGSIGGITPFGNLTVTSAQNVRVSSDFTGRSFTQVAGTGTTTIAGTMKTSTSIGISLTGNIFDITGSIITAASGPVSFNNAGSLTLSNGISSNGPVFQIGGGAVKLGSTITTTNTLAGSSSVSFTNAIFLTDSVVINTSIGGGDITFGALATVNGLQNISFIAGSGDISLSGEMGGLTPISALTIYSGGDVTLPAITGASLMQAHATGTTTLGGLVTITGDAGIVLVGNIFDINASIETFGVGSVIVQNSGLFSLNSGAQIDAAGAFIQMGTGTTGLYGNIESE